MAIFKNRQIMAVPFLLLAVLALVLLLKSRWTSTLPVVAVITLAMCAIAGSNCLHDRGVPGFASRRFAPVVGGFAYLIAIVWLEKWTAIILCGILTFSVLILRLKFRDSLRGLRGNHPNQTWAEITFVLSGTLTMLIGWGILDDRWLAFLPIAFLAWGDTAAGIARDIIGLDVKKSSWHMLAMLVICLASVAIWHHHPFWIGGVGAVVATLAERFRPGVFRYWDDNFNLTAASLAVMAVLQRIV
jgi:dolichol kinase